MAMPLVVPRYTLRDLESFPDDGSRYELLDGVLLVTPAPAPLHQLIAQRISTALAQYLKPADSARVFAPGSVEIDPRVHLEPDVLVVPADELRGRLRVETPWTAIRRWWLAVEVSGTGSTPYDRDYKGPAYLTLGVREYWRVDRRRGASISPVLATESAATRTGWCGIRPSWRSRCPSRIPDLFRP